MGRGLAGPTKRHYQAGMAPGNERSGINRRTLLIGGGRVVTLPLLLFNFASSGRNDIAGAIGIIYILPGVLILLLTAKHLSGRSGAVGGFGRI